MFHISSISDGKAKPKYPCLVSVLIYNSTMKNSFVVYTIVFLLLAFLIHTLTGCDSSLREKQTKAIDAYKQAIRIDPDYAIAHSDLGAAYFNSGMHKEAIEAYKQATRINPDYADAHFNLGVTYDESDRYKEAIEAYKQVIRINPDDADTHYHLGFLYNALDDKGSALEQYKILKNLNSEKANELFNMIYE